MPAEYLRNKSTYINLISAVYNNALQILLFLNTLYIKIPFLILNVANFKIKKKVTFNLKVEITKKENIEEHKKKFFLETDFHASTPFNFVTWQIKGANFCVSFRK